jgi:hypothetical protein
VRKTQRLCDYVGEHELEQNNKMESEGMAGSMFWKAEVDFFISRERRSLIGSISKFQL